MTPRSLERFLDTDPGDCGCDETVRLLHVYVDLVVEDPSEARAASRYPGVASHLLACPPCAEDFHGLLLAARGPNGPRGGVRGHL